MFLGKAISALLKNPLVYYIWDSPLKKQKNRIFENILSDNLKEISILDVGCGPGSNTELFLTCKYTGIDLNPKYISYAQKKFPGFKFINQDATQIKFPLKDFDLILLNGFLHHIPDGAVDNIVTHLAPALKDKGKIFILEPITPPANSILQNFLMRLDRGRYFRSEAQLKEIFNSKFKIEDSGLFPIKLLGFLVGWQVVALLLKKT